MLGHKTNISTFKKIENISRIFSNHNGIKWYWKKSSSKRKVYSNSYLLKKQEKSQIKKKRFKLNETRTRTNKNKVSRRKKTIKIRLLINKID